VAVAATVTLFGGLVSSEWIEHLDRRSGPELLFLLVMFAAPIGALALARR
jgi:predicted MFS family arabinose efflux permease